jgi:hypothetical protein
MTATVAARVPGRLRRAIHAGRAIGAVRRARRAVRGRIRVIRVTIAIIRTSGLRRLLGLRSTLVRTFVLATLCGRELSDALKGRDPHIALSGESYDLFIVSACYALK